MNVDATNIVSVVVAIVAAVAAYASQRASVRASVLNNTTSARIDMERDAYIRARALDTETIRRQDEELEECRQENRKARLEIRDVRIRMGKLERLLRAKGMTIPEDDDVA